MAQSGQLTSQSQVWKQGMLNWAAAGTVQELSGIFAPAANAASSSAQYNVAVNGQTTGPFDMNTLAEMSRSGQFTPQSQVWKQGMSGWAAAETVQELSTLLSQNAPPQTWEDYFLPVDGILNEYQKAECGESDEDVQANSTAIEETLTEFKIEAKVTGVCKGPVLTMYEILPAPGVKLSKITTLEDNIALRLASRSLRILAPIPGKQAVGIEVPNKKRAMVSFREIIDQTELENPASINEKTLPLYLGKTISGEALTADLAAMPHLLVAGSTGSGKSVCINTIILSLLYWLSPAECRMIFVDAKVVELKFYEGIPHLLTPVITEPKRALTAMQYCVEEMERRYELLAKQSSRNIKSYNKAAAEKGYEALPYIVVIIDEFADLMAVSSKELEGLIARLAAKSRAIGIHLVLATQRPSTNVVTGLIKSNIPARIAFMVTSNVDSRTILDSSGAEKLLGKGDMLYSGNDPFPVRAQGAFVSDDEAEKVVAHLKTLGTPAFVDIQ
jgi:S-DNA-T family DNA segregation ATPase FtsK/SpoIIIE